MVVRAKQRSFANHEPGQGFLCFSLLIRFIALSIFNFCPTRWLFSSWYAVCGVFVPETVFWLMTLLLIFLQIPRISSKVMNSEAFDKPLIERTRETPKIYSDY